MDGIINCLRSCSHPFLQRPVGLSRHGNWYCTKNNFLWGIYQSFLSSFEFHFAELRKRSLNMNKAFERPRFVKVQSIEVLRSNFIKEVFLIPQLYVPRWAVHLLLVLHLITKCCCHELHRIRVKTFKLHSFKILKGHVQQTHKKNICTI